MQANDQHNAAHTLELLVAMIRDRAPERFAVAVSNDVVETPDPAGAWRQYETTGGRTVVVELEWGPQ
jgi:hypothetical protein